MKKFLAMSALALMVSGAAMAAGAHETDTQNATVNLTIEKYVAFSVAPGTINLNYDPAVGGTASGSTPFTITANTPGHLAIGTPAGNFLPSWTVGRFLDAYTFGVGVSPNNFTETVSGISNTDPAGSSYSQTVPITATAD